MIRIAILVCAAALALVPPGASHAQGQPDALEHIKPDAKACADREQLAFGDAVLLFESRLYERETTGSASSDASDRLGRNDSVICPPKDLDPNIRPPGAGGRR